jgi:lipopolysaccharide/colanic/teichoic acid biosynthesis glycosyltransferase
MDAKRAFDLALTICGMILLLPLFAAIALWVKIDSPGPVFFRQTRIGRSGEPFSIIKFRTMVTKAEAMGPKITVDGDARVTRSGAFLRRWKLDELPQLINVLLGDMSLVGPRPEVPEYVACYPEGLRDKILSVRPGITDIASVEFRHESRILAESDDPLRAYIDTVLPDKLRYAEQYVDEHGIWTDLKIIAKTLALLVFPG